MAAQTPFSAKRRAELASKHFKSPSDALSPVSLALAARRKEPQAMKMRELLSADTRPPAALVSTPPAIQADTAPAQQSKLTHNKPTGVAARSALVLSPSTTHRPNLASVARKTTSQLHNTKEPVQTKKRHVVHAAKIGSPAPARAQHAVRMVR